MTPEHEASAPLPAAFHDGEMQIQERLGVREKLAPVGQRVFRNTMPDQHRALFSQLPYLMVGSLDAGGQPWASILTGTPGFVQVQDGGRKLTVPDYVGNFFFNTLGNLLLKPQAGLLLIDFDAGDLLYLAVEAEIIWNGPEVEAHPLAERLLRLHITHATHVAGSLPWRWSAPAFSPRLEDHGSVMT